MSKPDRSDEDDFYEQGFDQPGFVSVWAGRTDPRGREAVDVLQELCGVGYYRLSDQEGNNLDFQELPLQALLKDMSCAGSFMDEAVLAAADKACTRARWVVLQYDFAYDPARVARPIADEPVFIGAFPFSLGHDA